VVDLSEIMLVDGHSHQVTAAPVSDDEFAWWCTEASYAIESSLDSQLGSAIRRWCAPVLRLPAHADIQDYLAARREIGAAAATRDLLRAARLATMLIDTGTPSAGLAGLKQMAELAAADTHEVVRLEALAESVVDEAGAANFADAVRESLDRAYADGAVAAKSIAAYRHGLDLAPERPTQAEVRTATEEWLRARSAGSPRLTDPVLLRHLLWCAVDARRPIQLHTGFGDADATLIRADPAWLQPFCAATQDHGVPLVLLHCYPFHRNAGWLAHVYPHVYVDVGLSVGYLGTRATALLAEFLELAPFGKVMYSSDAYGLAELYLVGAAQFRHSLGRVLQDFLDDGAVTVKDALAIATAIGSGTASRLYGLQR